MVRWMPLVVVLLEREVGVVGCVSSQYEDTSDILCLSLARPLERDTKAICWRFHDSDAYVFSSFLQSGNFHWMISRRL